VQATGVEHTEYRKRKGFHMALADDTRVGASAVGNSPAAEYDRTPPQDIAAEQSVLGGMLLSKDAIADVIEVVRPNDFYRPAHQLVYDAILDLYSRGEPADAVTVSAELVRSGQLARVGGAQYLHTLISTVPTAANAGYYASIVAERATLRRLVTAGTRIVQMGYDTASGSAGIVGSVDDVVDRAQAEVYEVTERRTSEDYVHIETLLQGTMDEIDRISATGGIGTGIPTGFGRLDEITNGLHPGQMITVAGRPGSGKALALDTVLPTPTGFTTMGEVRVGQLLLGADGHPTRVVAATDVLVGRPCYEVKFSDGSVIVADAEHQWRTVSRAVRQLLDERVTAGAVTRADISQIGSTGTGGSVASGGSIGEATIGVATWHAAPIRSTRRRTAAGAPYRQVATTELLARTLYSPTARPRFNHAIECVAPLQLAEADLPMHPRDLGLALRHSAESGLDRIPMPYLRAGQQQRQELLQGLLPYGRWSNTITVATSELAEDVVDLLSGLGYVPTIAASDDGREHTVNFKREYQPLRFSGGQRLAMRPISPGAQKRYITAIRAIESVPVRCVQVDNAENMYLAGRTMIPTHNSTLALDFARASAIKNHKPTVVFSLEMGKTEIMMRLFSAEASVPLRNMRSGHMTDQDWTRMARRSGELAEAPLYIDDSPNLTMMEIRAKARRLRQRHDLQMIVIDYLQLMTSGKRVESRQQEVSEFSRAIKLLAKELDLPVIALSQLNRGPEQRTDKKPMLSDLRESGSIEQDSDLVLLVHREDMYEKESPRAGEADIIIAKHRNGPTATVAVSFQGHYSRFADMPE
jgi:replicative DNA helicase